MPEVWVSVLTGALAGALLSLPAVAQDVPAAIGRISQAEEVRAGTAICTGALVAPDLVLTAAHCLRGAMADPTRIRFAFDWRQGHPAELRHGVEVMLTQGKGGSGLTAFAEDMALIRLNQPSVVPPLELAAVKESLHQDSIFQMFAFRRDASDRIMGPTSCPLVAQLPGFLGLGCPVVSGNSGAPVLGRIGQGWEISAVMVAADKGAVQAWALPLPDWVREFVLP